MLNEMTIPAEGVIAEDGTYAVDIRRGEVRGELNRQWANRPDDQRFTSLSDLTDQVRRWAEQSAETMTTPMGLDAFAEDGRLRFRLGGEGGEIIAPTHHAFGALAQLARVPADYLRSDDVPAELAAACLTNGFANASGRGGLRELNAYIRRPGDGDTLLRALTSDRYGRIYDWQVAEAVSRIAGDGTGDTRWKIPGTIDWRSYGAGTVRYDPNTPITKQSTTLYASDRDVWMFLCDDRNPIEVGKLDNGNPDLMFRGFMAWNSEVGARTMGLATMYLRAVCQNRNLWGCEGFRELTVRHTTTAPGRLSDLVPVLESYANADTGRLVTAVKAAKAAKVADDEEERIGFLQKFGFSAKAAKAMIGKATEDEGHPPSSVWDMAQAVTAAARDVPHQDKRIGMELIGQKMLDRVG